MQRALAIICCCWAAEIGAGPVPPPKNLQVLTADSNAGPANVIPSTVNVELPGDDPTVKPPPGLGSGKSETPWVRIHLASANCTFDFVADLWLAPPHAATASAQPTAASAAERGGAIKAASPRTRRPRA